ncbi:MAG: MerR family transcriptional regulator [Chloroflexi bacterium]|nr:MerR family transcriptional regulator [Chloroflexota bacterium]
MSSNTYSPRETAAQLGVAERTLRYWSAEFAAWFTPSAIAVSTGRGTSHRRYTDADLAVLRQIRQLTARRTGLDAVRAALGAPQSPAGGSSGRPRPPQPRPTRDAPPAVVTPSPVAEPDRHEQPAALPSSGAALPPEGQAFAAAVAPWEAPAPSGENVPPEDTERVLEAARGGAALPAAGVDAAPGDPPALLVAQPQHAGDTSAAATIPANDAGASRNLVTRAAAMEDLALSHPSPGPDVSAQLADVVARLEAIESTLADLVALLAERHPAPVAPPPRRWWWPFGTRRASPPGSSTVGRRLARLAAERMLTRQELAVRAGLPISTVQALLTGRRAPNPGDLAALAAALDVEESAITASN